MSQTPPRQWLMFLLAGMACVLIYSNALHAPFYLDDEQNIQLNRHIRLTDLSFAGLADAAFASPHPRRPVANISFALNYYFGRYHVFGYHVVNVMIHLANGILLYLLLKTILGLPSVNMTKQNQERVAFWASLLWICHPVHVQSVTYIVQRMNSLSCFFYILSLFLFLRGRLSVKCRQRWAWFSGALFSSVLAISSKEIAATLPVFALLFEWYFFRNLSWTWLKSRFIYCLYGFLFVLAMVFFYLGFNPVARVLSGYSFRDFTLTERVLTQFRVVGHYVSLLAYPAPSRLSLLHDFPISRSLVDPMTTLFSFGAVLGLALLACWSAKRYRLLSFSVLWFLGNLAIESSVINLEVIFEHRTYLPSMLLPMLFVLAVHKTIPSKSTRTVLLSLVILTFSLWTYQRNTLWANDVAFWHDSIQKAPRVPRGHHNLGNLHLRNGDMDDALNAYKKSLDIKPDFVLSQIGAGIVFRHKGQIEDALTMHRKAVALAPAYEPAYNQLGLDYIELGSFHLATETLKKAVELDPYSHEAYNNMGQAYIKTGDVGRAISMFKQAITINPDFSMAYNNLGAVYLSSKPLEASRLLQKAVELDSRSSDAFANLGIAAINSGDIEIGISHLNQALRIQPGHANATFNLAKAYELIGSYEKAIEQYDNSIQLDPDDLQAYYSAGLVSFYHLENKKQAMHYFQKALSVGHGHSEYDKIKKLITELNETGHE